MTYYKNLSGNSGVFQYEIGEDFIIVRFKTSARLYKYSYKKAGKENVEKMKALAKSGSGLNSFISSSVRYLYD